MNASPSLTSSNQEDYDLKFGLLNDVLNVLDMENRLTGKERRIGLFDLLWDDGAVMLDDSVTGDYVNNFTTSLNTFLGQFMVLLLIVVVVVVVVVVAVVVIVVVVIVVVVIVVFVVVVFVAVVVFVLLLLLSLSSFLG